MDAVIPVDSSEPSLNTSEALELELRAIHELLREQRIRGSSCGLRSIAKVKAPPSTENLRDSSESKAAR
jgi:hypothetical protein